MAVEIKHRKQNISLAIFLFIALIIGAFADSEYKKKAELEKPPTVSSPNTIDSLNKSPDYSAFKTLNKLDIKGRAPKTGYSRSQFGDGWAVLAGCDMRNRILKRDLTNITLQPEGCLVRSGTLRDPYTSEIIRFVRGATTSQEVQIDHVVALSDAWQKGAQLLSFELRDQLANDPLNLLAVQGRANQNKGDGDAATWLPENKQFRCSYVARQIAVKYKYSLWVTLAEFEAINRVMKTCPNQPLPKY